MLHTCLPVRLRTTAVTVGSELASSSWNAPSNRPSTSELSMMKYWNFAFSCYARTIETGRKVVDGTFVSGRSFDIMSSSESKEDKASAPHGDGNAPCDGINIPCAKKKKT